MQQPESAPHGSSQALGSLRVLYVSTLVPDYYGEYRLRALSRLPLGGLAALDCAQYIGPHGFLGKLQFRLQAGPGTRRLNRDILAAAEDNRANLLLCDKVLSLRPATLRELRRRGLICVNYVNDNPFGPRRDPGWRVYKQALPAYDLTAVPRDSSVEQFRSRGAPEVKRIRFSYEPTVHFPPSAGWSDVERDRGVSFIGTPYDRRADFLTRLWRAGAPVAISGSRPHWQAALPADAFAAVFRRGELKGSDYREAIWRSRINLAFVTRSNADTTAHKAFEITACGGFLLAERTEEHQQLFREDVEAVFFGSLEECRAKIDHYLNDEPARAAIAAAGLRRAQSSGYDNDSVLRTLLERAAQMLQARSGAAL
jgi:spore maturation protein CgeB